MKRFVGIACCLFLLLAGAAWALEKCQSLVAHHGGHEHSEEVSHAHTHGFDVAQDQSLPGNPVIHCVDSREIPSFISQPQTRLARPLVPVQILPASYYSAMAESRVWITNSEKRPPGSFLSAVSPYLFLSVLRF